MRFAKRRLVRRSPVDKSRVGTGCAMSAVTGDANGFVECQRELLFDVMPQANELTLQVRTGVGGHVHDVVVSGDDSVEQTSRPSREMPIGLDKECCQPFESRWCIIR
jgi:hypothetical protein